MSSANSTPTAYAEARKRIDAAHSADPSRASDGRPAELVYADGIEKWVVALDANASPILRLAARCQHLERWLTPRSSFPMDKIGYHAWRKSLYTKQAERARTLMLEAGISSHEAAEAAVWISKTGLKTNPGTQALEDAAVLVFLESEIPGFAAKHPDYTPEKYIDILRKTWRKLSPRGQQLAQTISLPDGIAALLKQAIGG